MSNSHSRPSPSPLPRVAGSRLTRAKVLQTENPVELPRTSRSAAHPRCIVERKNKDQTTLDDLNYGPADKQSYQYRLRTRREASCSRLRCQRYARDAANKARFRKYINESGCEVLLSSDLNYSMRFARRETRAREKPVGGAILRLRATPRTSPNAQETFSDGFGHGPSISETQSNDACSVHFSPACTRSASTTSRMSVEINATPNLPNQTVKCTPLHGT